MSSGRSSHALISANLDLEVLNLLSYLGSIWNNHDLHKHDVIARALYRYENYWLPLAADHSQEGMSAPPDIQLVWFCHMIFPEAYRNDCSNIVGQVINHTIVDQKQYKVNLSVAQKYWNTKYKSSREPFYAFSGRTFYGSDGEGKTSKISVDIHKMVEHVLSFYLKVSLAHFTDQKFRKESLERYRKFLLLRQTYPDKTFVPTNDILMVSLAHRANPGKYKADMNRMFSECSLNENDVIFSIGNSKLYIETCATWKDKFNEMYPRFGALYGGVLKETGTKLTKLSEADIYNISTKETYISLNKLVLHLPRHMTGEEFKKLRITITACCGEEEQFKWFTQKRIIDGSGTKRVEFDIPEEILQFNTDSVDFIRIDLERKIGRGCRSAVEFLGAGFYDMLTPVESASFMGGGTFAVTQELADDVTLDMQGSFTAPDAGAVRLKLNMGEFKAVTNIEDVREIYDLLGLGEPQIHADSQCATHSVLNHAKKECFTVKVFHLPTSLMSAVQVLHGDSTVATVSLVSSEMLPHPSQIETGVLTLDVLNGERAVVIRNKHGDWAIVTARWESTDGGTKKGSENVQRGSGQMFVTIYKTSSGKSEIITLTNTQTSCTLVFGSLSADLIEGSVVIGEPDTSEVAENLALTFAVSLLYTLLVSRPRGWKPGQSLTSDFIEDNKADPIVYSDKMEFMLASGVLCDCPSNQNIRERFGADSFAMYDCFGNAGDRIRHTTDYAAFVIQSVSETIKPYKAEIL